MDKKNKLIKSMESELSNISYPLRNPVEIAPQLTNGSETVFVGNEIEYEAVNIIKELNKHIDEDSPNEGFPYQSSDCLVEDIEYALRQEDVI